MVFGKSDCCEQVAKQNEECGKIENNETMYLAAQREQANGSENLKRTGLDCVGNFGLTTGYIIEMLKKLRLDTACLVF